ncbi:hypothetical protein AC249_AIPGENE29092 [Exaiptasia diaphana]|nr:hypothetical protein AC249_AIPGENE29092 [Exaiptasia diaphana]
MNPSLLNAHNGLMKTSCSPNPCQNGGQCTVKDRGTNYTCTCVGRTGRNCEEKCVLFDFESGRLEGWNLTGTAFNNQPTYGDNTLARGKPSANLKGKWFVGTFEDRPSPSHPAAGQQGNGPTGTATSPTFVIRGTKLRFLIGGESNINTERLELLIGGSVVAKATSTQSDHPMTMKSFDVTAYKGKEARVRLVDMSSGSWGLLNVDQIEDSYCSE